MPHFHVSSSLNRTSIKTFGLDWTRMSAAPGIAGSLSPEAEGCFLVESEMEAEWFLRMNNTGGPVDLWRVEGVDPTYLVDNGHGYYYLPGTIPREQVALVRADNAPEPMDR